MPLDTIVKNPVSTLLVAPPSLLSISVLLPVLLAACWEYELSASSALLAAVPTRDRAEGARDSDAEGFRDLGDERLPKDGSR